MSGQTTFDPYHEWLGIHPSEQPADFYRLLGVCRFENNVAVIQGAYAQRFNHLRKFHGTPHEAIAQQLAQELLSAQTALLSPVLKSSYDAGLLARMQPPPAPEPQPEQPAWEPATTTVGYDAPVVRRKPMRKSDGPLKQMAGSVAGLIIGFIILMYLRPEFDGLGLFHALPVEPPPKKEPVKPEKREQIADDKPAKSPREDWIRDQKPPRQPEHVNRPVEAPAPILIPAQIDLPDRNGHGHVEAAQLGTADIAFDIRNPDGNPVQFQVTGADDQQAWSISDGHNDIAYLKRENGRINFYWAEGTPEAAECLRNALLVVTAGGDEKTVVLRFARTEKAPAIDLELKGKADKITLPLELELHGLDPSKLQFEVVGSLDAITFQRFDPQSKQAAANHKVRAILRDQPPYAAFDVSVTVSGKVFAAKIWPLMVGNDSSDTLPWTVDRVNTINRRLNAKITTAKAAVTQLPQTIQEIQKQIGQLSRVPSNNVLYAAAQADLAAAQVALANAQTNLAAAQSVAPVSTKQLENLKTLADLGNSISKKLRIQFRVFYVVAGQEIDVFRADDGLDRPERPMQRIAAAKPALPPEQEQQPARKDEKPIAAGLRQSLDKFRELLASRELEAAKEVLDSLIVTDDIRSRVESAKALHHYVERFWSAVREGAKKLESGSDFALRGSDRASVVEGLTKGDRITLRMRGENKTYHILDLPADAAVGLAEGWLAKDDPNSKIFVAAFLAVDSPENLGAAHQMLNEAKSAGSDIAQAVWNAIED